MAEALREAIGDRTVHGFTVIDGGASPKKPVVIGALTGSAELETALRDALAGDRRRELRAQPRVGVDLAALRRAGADADIVICDLDRTQPQALEAISAFVADPKSPPLIVTGPGLDVAAVCELVHRGVHHILLQPLKAAELDQLLTHALARGRELKPAGTTSPAGLVISLIGSCGGVGTTSLAVQGACALSRLKRYKRATDLCLFDLDVQFGSAALMLDARQNSSVIDLVRAPERLDGEMLRGSMVRAGDRFDLLAAPLGFVAIDDIDPDAVAAAIKIASREYALTIVDLPNLWSHWTHAVLSASTVIALVTQPTVPSLRHGRRQIDMLRAEDLDDIPLAVVLNRVIGGLLGPTGVSAKGAEAALGRKVDYQIPENPAMRAAADAGIALGDARGGRALETRIVEMFDGIIASCAGSTQLALADD